MFISTLFTNTFQLLSDCDFITEKHTQAGQSQVKLINNYKIRYVTFYIIKSMNE